MSKAADILRGEAIKLRRKANQKEREADRFIKQAEEIEAKIKELDE